MIQICTGWILDVYIENDEAVLWIKTDNGKAIKLVDEYEPTFYLQPVNEAAGEEILQLLCRLELVKEAKWDYKFTDIGSDVKLKLVYVNCYSIHHYNLLLKGLQQEILQKRIRRLFDTRLSHIQRYLFGQLRAPSSTKVKVEYQDGYLVSCSKLTDNDLHSPYSIMHVEVTMSTEEQILDKDDPIRSIAIRSNSSELVLEDSESKMLEEFSNYIVSRDPDVIIFNQDTILSYLLERMKVLSLDLPLGRRRTNTYSVNQRHVVEKWGQGRIYLSEREYGQTGIATLIELSQFSHLPIRMILKYSVGRLISNRNICELIQRGHIISDNSQRTHEQIRTLEDIIERDKAGMVFTPKVGLHENVAVLDYNDEFANIIINHSIGYEIASNKRQILPQIVKQLVDRRTYLRQFLKQLPSESLEAKYCEERADTLKKILVCLYGTTGSYWNKYGNVAAFEEINSKSRQILLKTKDIVQQHGFELVYADTDAAFIHKDNATKDDYEKLCETIGMETGMAISREFHYKLLVLLPLEADEKLEALKHYFGITYEGELITRGIETRRHDTPAFIKEFQSELLYTLFECDSSEQIFGKTLENALLCVTKTIDKVMTGEIKLQDLVISKQLRMDITKYKSIFPHVAAALQLCAQNGKSPTRGDMIEYVYTNSQHQNPLNRVTTIFDDTDEISYDKEKYKEMLLDAAETVLGIFGFDRTVYGGRKNKKWWEELKKSRLQDIQAEINS
jgi:DNA polymerase elongation subunit (family B)